MADWPKKHLERATLVRVECDDYAWEMDGAVFVSCLESGGWRQKHNGQDDLQFACLRAVAAKTLMAESPGQFPSLTSAARLASLVTAAILKAQDELAVLNS